VNVLDLVAGAFLMILLMMGCALIAGGTTVNIYNRFGDLIECPAWMIFTSGCAGAFVFVFIVAPLIFGDEELARASVAYINVKDLVARLSWAGLWTAISGAAWILGVVASCIQIKIYIEGKK
jgi:hypothetical protein